MKEANKEVKEYIIQIAKLNCIPGEQGKYFFFNLCEYNIHS